MTIRGLFVFAQQDTTISRLTHISPSRLSHINNMLRAGTRHQEKPTVIQQRVIAQAYSDPYGYDSTRYTYSGTRGSTYTHNLVGWGYSRELTTYYPPLLNNIREVPSSNMLADSIILYTEDKDVGTIYAGHYRSDNKLDSFLSINIIDIGGNTFTKRHLSYYPGGYLKQKVTRSGVGGLHYDTTYVQQLTYNNLFTQITSDSLFSGAPPVPYQKRDYRYNTAGRVDTVVTTEILMAASYYSEMNIYSYTAEGKIRSITTYLDKGDGVFDYLYAKDSFAYTDNSDYFTYWQEIDFERDGSVMGGSRMIQYPGANSLPDSAILSSLENNNTWQKALRLKYAYNSFNNPTHAQVTMSPDGPDEVSGLLRFYYEEYNDGLSVSGPVKSDQPLTVFPNPLSKTLFIDWKASRDIGYCTLYLVNMAGQKVFQAKLKPQPGTNAVSLPELPGGSYTLLLLTPQGTRYSTKVLKK